MFQYDQVKNDVKTCQKQRLRYVQWNLGSPDRDNVERDKDKHVSTNYTIFEQGKWCGHTTPVGTWILLSTPSAYQPAANGLNHSAT